MKLSLRWVFDHISADWQSIAVEELAQTFIKTTAEVEQIEKISCPIRVWFIGSVVEKKSDQVIFIIPETNSTISLPIRPEVKVGLHYLVKKEDDIYLWVSMRDIGSSKEGFVPSFAAESSEMLGSWRDQFESDDVIITVDNKSINHRPDLWGHRGIARELATKYKLPFVAENTLLARHEIQVTAKDQAKIGTISVENESKGSCSRFAGIELTGVVNHLSDIEVVVRLARAEVRSIDAIVDATNYVMLDWGHPLHAFDAAQIGKNSLIIRNARNKEQLTLLDTSTITLQDQDIIIADPEKPLSLAGIMGGNTAAVTMDSKKLLVEAACFDGTTIRNSSNRLAKRTESSSRFEKGLNPAILENTLLRFLKVLHDRAITHTISSPLVVLGTLPSQKKVTVSHSLIESRLGVSLAHDFVKDILTKLGFAVEQDKDIYTITIPYARSKDITIAEDIIEEVGRFYGYDQITPAYPLREMKPFSMQSILRLRQLKRYLSYGINLREEMTYAFFDESFLKKIAWQPEHTLTVKEAVSDNWRRLVTTLTPNLLNIVQSVASEVETFGVYEVANIWPHEESGIREHCVVSGISADFKKAISFYEGKTDIESLLRIFGLNVAWKKIDQPPFPWYMPYQSAWIMHNERRIGIAGKVNPLFYQTIATGDAFIWELDADYILTFQAPLQRYKVPSKYPRVTRDISMLVPRDRSVEELLATMSKADARIIKVAVVDCFEKDEWKDQKSVTARFIIEDHAKTLTSAEVDMLVKQVTTNLEKLGAHIR